MVGPTVIGLLSPVSPLTQALNWVHDGAARFIYQNDNVSDFQRTWSVTPFMVGQTSMATVACVWLS